MQPYTIAHIADLHLSGEHKRFSIRRVRSLLDAIVRREVDHVVVAGDIAADADPKDFEIARRLFKNAGLLDPRRLTVVIGNHDIYGGVHHAEDILTFPRRCKETQYGKKVKEFRAYFAEAFEGCQFAADGKTFPFAKVLVKNPVGSNGEVDDREFERIGDLLKDPLVRDKRKIVIIHHHFHKMSTRDEGALKSVWGAIERQTMKLRGKSKLFDLFKDHGVSMVLHGHVHLSFSYERRDVRFANAGGSVFGPDATKSTSYNLVRLFDQAAETTFIRVPIDGSSSMTELASPAAARELIAA
jgi:3',5'-cyclic AMP phosphodiesterase CpdA